MGLLEILFDVSLYGYFLATAACTAWFLRPKRGLWLAGTALLGLGLLSQVAFIIGRAAVAGRPPFASVFETLVFLAACVAAFSLAASWLYGKRSISPAAALAALLATVLAGTLTEDIRPLVPALRDSYWLTVHVAFCMVGYAAFLLSYFTALACLLKDDRSTTAASLAVALNVSGLTAGLAVRAALGWGAARGSTLLVAAGAALVAAVGLWPLVAWGTARLRIRERLPEAEDLEKATYRLVAFGFPLLTVGIATGSYWAEKAWGRYWGWDDKEVGALVTWLVYAVYLHLRSRWRSPWVAWAAAAGFWSVLFTYFGVTYLLGGLHSHT